MRNLSIPFLFVALMSFAIGCQQHKPSNEQKIADAIAIPDAENFRDTIDGQIVELYTLRNSKGMEVALTNFGARIVSIIVPDKDSIKRDVVLGFAKAGDYHNNAEPYFGPVVGPFGNRIAEGKFTLDGEEYTLPTNNGPNTLHGGNIGLHFIVWDAQVLSDQSVLFSCKVADGTEGFPGNRELQVTYSLNDDNELLLEYEGRTDKQTVLNLTNHAYFNLNGEGSGTILNHQLQIFANQFTPVDETLIPLGEHQHVENTPFDFRELKPIGQDIEQDHEQLTYGKGYDHNFVLGDKKRGDLTHACQLIGDQSGIVMDVYTEEPGLQFYSGNFMAEKVTLKHGAKDSFRTGLCLETQHFPDSPNQVDYPTTVLAPGQVYKTKSIYKFSVK